MTDTSTEAVTQIALMFETSAELSCFRSNSEYRAVAETLRALAAERDALRAALEKTRAVLEQIESHRRLCMQYDEDNGHVPRTFDDEDFRIMEIAARAALKGLTND